MNWLIARLKEGSTWRGIVWLLTVAGISLKPDQVEAIIAAGMALAGLLGVFTRDLSANDSQAQRTELPPIELQSPGVARAGLADSGSAVDSGDGVGRDGRPGYRQSLRVQHELQAQRPTESRYGFNDQ